MALQINLISAGVGGMSIFLALIILSNLIFSDAFFDLFIIGYIISFIITCLGGILCIIDLAKEESK